MARRVLRSPLALLRATGKHITVQVRSFHRRRNTLSILTVTLAVLWSAFVTACAFPAQEAFPTAGSLRSPEAWLEKESLGTPDLAPGTALDLPSATPEPEPDLAGFPAEQPPPPEPTATAQPELPIATAAPRLPAVRTQPARPHPTETVAPPPEPTARPIATAMPIPPTPTAAAAFAGYRGGLAPDLTSEEAMLAAVNRQRAAAGLAPLIFDAGLQEVARRHSAEMIVLGYFSHTSPNTGSPFDRLVSAGIAYTTAGENLAAAPDVDLAMTALMNSPGHRANILQAAFGHIGVGAFSGSTYGRMFVQLFTN